MVSPKFGESINKNLQAPQGETLLCAQKTPYKSGAQISQINVVLAGESNERNGKRLKLADRDNDFDSGPATPSDLQNQGTVVLILRTHASSVRFLRIADGTDDSFIITMDSHPAWAEGSNDRTALFTEI